MTAPQGLRPGTPSYLAVPPMCIQRRNSASLVVESTPLWDSVRAGLARTLLLQDRGAQRLYLPVHDGVVMALKLTPVVGGSLDGQHSFLSLEEPLLTVRGVGHLVVRTFVSDRRRGAAVRGRRSLR